MKCLNCKSPLKNLPGKRAKKFCNSTCRSHHWQKQARIKKEETEEVAIEGSKTNDGPSIVVSKDNSIVAEMQKAGIPKTLKELKEFCPKELSGLARSSWIATNRKFYNI